MDKLISAEHPNQRFLRRDETTTNVCRKRLARTYDAQAKLRPVHSIPLGPLEILHVSELFSFDQVWHQLETRNSTLIPFAARRIEALVQAAEKGEVVSALNHDEPGDGPSSDEDVPDVDGFSNTSGLLSPSEVSIEEQETTASGEQEYDRTSKSIPTRSSPQSLKPKRRVRFDLNPQEEHLHAPNMEPSETKSGPSRTGSIEDGFFSIADMEAFADDAEMLAQQGKLIASDDESDGDISGAERRHDFVRFESDDEEVEEEGDDSYDPDMHPDMESAETRDKHKFLYSDFFDPPGGSEVADAVRVARTRALLLDEVDQNGSGNDIDESDTPNDADEARNETVQTNLQKTRAKTRKTIEAIEEANVNKRPWMLRGEVPASARPKDSLLEAELEHDIAVAPKAFITNDSNEALEDVIKQRVADGLFDDVVMALPEDYAEKKNGGKKELPEISQDKPKESLADMYEREFTEEDERKRRETEASTTVRKEEDKPESKEQKEVNQLWDKLSKKLDALSTLHFQPTPQEEAEMSVKDNIKALSKEEAIPEAVSDANLLAPKEVFSVDKSNEKGEREVTKEERRAKRRRNKAKGKRSKAATKTIDDAKVQANPVLADKRRAENALARRGKKVKTNVDERSSTKREVDASFAQAAFKAREMISKSEESGSFAKKPVTASQLRL